VRKSIICTLFACITTSSCANSNDETKTKYNCAPWATIISTETQLTNNTWGVKETESGEQCIAKYDDKYAWNWSWNNTSHHIITFPSITYGFKPWDNKSTNNALPKLISDISSIPVSFHFNQKATGAQNLLLEAWLVDSNKPITKDTIKREVGIHFFQNGWTGQAGKFISSVNISGVNYDVYFSNPWKTERGHFHWQYISFVQKDFFPNPSTVSIDFKLFLNAIETLGLTTNYLTLASLELGTEVVRGTGNVEISEFDISIESSTEKINK